MNPIYWTVIAAVLGLVSLFIKEPDTPFKDDPAGKAPAGSFIMLAIVCAGLVGAAWRWPMGETSLMPAALGFAVGGFLAAFTAGLGYTRAAAWRCAPLGLATAGVAACGYLGDGASLGYVFGIAISSWLVDLGGVGHENPWAMRAAFWSACIVVVDQMAGYIHQEHLGLALGIVGLLAAILTAFFAKAAAMRALFAATIVTIGGWLLSAKLFGLPDLWQVMLAGSVIGLVVGWFLPDEDEPSSFRASLAAIIWIGAASGAFSYYHGVGMAAILLSGAAVLLILGRQRAVLSMGPLAALVTYRLFREAHPDVSRAFDIGQHYGMIGVLLGATIPLVAMEWLRGPGHTGVGRALAGAGWIGIFLLIPGIAGVLLGAKGITGFLVGLGLAGVIESIRGIRASHAISLTMGFGFLTILAYDSLQPYTDLERGEKLIAVAWLAGIVLALSFVIGVLSLRVGQKKALADG